MVNNTVYQFFSSNLGVEIFFEKREQQKKGVCWNKRLRLLFTLCIRVSRKFYLHSFFKLRYYMQNGAKFLQKLTPRFKITWEIETTSRRQWKIQSWNLMGCFCPKNTLLQLEHYVPKIYLTLLATICVKIHQITSVIFETMYKLFWQHSSSVFFCSKITYFLQK